MAELLKEPLTSMDIKEHQLKKLKELFPEAFTEGYKVDWDKLRLSLGAENVDTGKERYGMNWPGKSDCFKTIQQPSIATLIPSQDESVAFDTTKNLFIEGDNLEVLKLLQKAYLGKIRMMYFDPPYNTGNDFIYPDNYSESLDTYLAYTGQVDAEGKRFSTNPETDGRFHSKWLSMMYPRLFLAKNLLSENGVMFISIGQTELSNLIQVCNEIFGEENKIGIISRVMKSGGNSGKYFSPNIDYILVYAKNSSELPEFRDEMDEELIKNVYTQIQKEGKRAGEKYRLMGLYQSSLTLERSRNARYYITCPDNSKVIPPEGKRWRVVESSYNDMLNDGLIEFKETDTSPLVDEEGQQSKWNIYTKIWLTDRQEEGRIPVDLIEKWENRHSSKELQSLGIPFEFAKPSELIKYLINIVGVNDYEIVLDFFAGSCTTAHAALNFNFQENKKIKFICIQLPEEANVEGFKSIADIGKERIRRAIKKIEGDIAESKLKDDEKLFSEQKDTSALDLGFKVYKLAPSNFKIWDATLEKSPELIQQKLFDHINHISPEAEQEAILYELLLKSGFELTTPIEKLALAGKTVFSIAEGQLIICLEKQLTHDVIKAMGEMKPSRVICLDEAFKGENADALKTNAVQIMKSKGVLNFRTV